MHHPDALHYHPADTWAAFEEDGRVRIGITDFAQDQLGDIVWVELPKVGTEVVAGEAFGEIESAKTVSDLGAPISGTVVEIHEDVVGEPERINSDPYGNGWLILVDPSGEATDLLSGEEYRAKVEGQT